MKEQDISIDNSGNDEILKTFKEKGHYQWFDYLDPKLKDKIKPFMLNIALKYGLERLTKQYGYNLKRVIVKDKDEVVGFFIWTDKGTEIDDIGDGKVYPVILSTAVHPEYRNRGLLKRMIETSGIEKPYLVQTGPISPIGLWEKLGCKIVKKIAGGNSLKKCD